MTSDGDVLSCHANVRRRKANSVPLGDAHGKGVSAGDANNGQIGNQGDALVVREYYVSDDGNVDDDEKEGL